MLAANDSVPACLGGLSVPGCPDTQMSIGSPMHGGKGLLPTHCCGLSWVFFFHCLCRYGTKNTSETPHKQAHQAGRSRDAWGISHLSQCLTILMVKKCFLMSNLSLPWHSSVPFLSCHQFPAAEPGTSVCLPSSGSCTEPPLLHTRQVQLDETLLGLKFQLLEDSMCS